MARGFVIAEMDRAEKVLKLQVVVLQAVAPECRIRPQGQSPATTRSLVKL